jgi:threonylcarbamoyladenosine tRNA methylthiotransferase MtaB
MNQTFFSVALGCRVNQAEKELIDRQLIEAGFSFDEKNPSIIIINTCTVTHKADRESRQIVNQWRRKAPQAKIVVTGCAATYWLKYQQTNKIPFDLAIDNQNKELLVKRIFQLTNIKKEIDKKGQWRNFFIDKYLSSKRILIKIQDGCHRFCSFCIVPYLRGLPKSIPAETIVDLINQSIIRYQVKEVILTAINTEAYGRDREDNFAHLIERVALETKIERISFGSIHPWSINDRLISTLSSIYQAGRLVNYFHIPLQSGSNKVLQLMKRGYTKQEYEEQIKKINQKIPHSFFATDVIVGYLNESDEDFDETYQFLEKLPINKFHVFRFSARQKTAAYYMKKYLKEPSEKVKKERSLKLRKLSEKKYQNFVQFFVGKEDKVLVINKKNSDGYEGLLTNQLPIVVTNGDNFVGEIKKVKIFDCQGTKLFGKIIN